MSRLMMSLVRQIADRLRQMQVRIVFAESCTAGLVSATLAREPGISEFHCGSAVVYRVETKRQWLGVPAALLDEFGAVSDPVARAMALGVLQRTPEADCSAAITGHLGPNSPADQDGLVFVAWARRNPHGLDATTFVIKTRLPTEIPAGDPAENLREWRQRQATQVVLQVVLDNLGV